MLFFELECPYISLWMLQAEPDSLSLQSVGGELNHEKQQHSKCKCREGVRVKCLQNGTLLPVHNVIVPAFMLTVELQQFILHGSIDE